MRVAPGCRRWFNVRIRKGIKSPSGDPTRVSPSEIVMNAWQKIQNYLKGKVNTQSYQTWLRPTRLSHAADDTLYVRVPNREFEEWIAPGKKAVSIATRTLA